MKIKIKLFATRVALWIVSLGPVVVDLAKHIIHLASHLFGGGCTGV